jgi:putative tryptophan/tyrosine transport system substrate-binding protein
MNKKVIIAGIVLIVLVCVGAWYHFSEGRSKPGKVYHVGILSGLDFFLPTVDGLKQKMTELGYVEGKNITYDLQKTNFEPAKEQQILNKFVSDKDDLIFTFPTEVSLAAKATTKGTNIPVVFADAYTEGVDLIDSVSKPGGNITGVRFPGAELSIKRLEYIHELLPNAKRIWVAYQKDYPPVPPMMEKVRAAAATMGITLIEVPALGPGDITADLDARSKQTDIGVDAILVVAEPLTIEPGPFAEISKFADDHKLMIADSTIIPGNTGPLFSDFTDSVEVGKQAAVLIDKVFKGIPAGGIPVTSPEDYLRVNYQVAQKIGLPLDEGFLSKATEIIR